MEFSGTPGYYHNGVRRASFAVPIISILISKLREVNSRIIHHYFKDTMPEIFPTLHSQRLHLIEIKQQHLGDLFKLFGDRKVTRFYNIVTLETKSDAQKIIDWFQNRFLKNEGIRWGIALKEQSTIIGTIGFNNFTVNHRANLGYDLQAAYWNQGIITEAVQVVIQYGFDVLKINRIEAEVMQNNSASEKVLEKTGFKKEGILRHWMYWNDHYYDMSMFSILRSDFLQK